MTRLSALVFVLAACGSDGAEGAAGPQGEMGDEGEMGDKGDKGDQGTDGQLRIYGDGSAGALTVTTDSTLFVDVAADGNLMFTDVTIDAGVTLRVTSGVVIRCSGTFTNNGTVTVLSVARTGGAVRTSTNTTPLGVIPAEAPPNAGVSFRAASSGELGDSTGARARRHRRNRGVLRTGEKFAEARGVRWWGWWCGAGRGH